LRLVCPICRFELSKTDFSVSLCASLSQLSSE
jgi:hypothetical protein